MRNRSIRAGASGLTLTEVLIVLSVAGTLAALTLTGFRSFRDAHSMRAAAWSVRNELALARSLALGRREVVRVTVDPELGLTILDSSGRRLGGVTIGPDGDLAVDSIRTRPRTLRFNSRGQAAPGSVYLYGKGRVVRVVCNFLGRLRVEVHRDR
jgi:prepilin-type N-terminal cleavage/methylation domain-containing protein